MRAGEQTSRHYHFLKIIVIIIGFFSLIPDLSYSEPIRYNATLKYLEDQDGLSQQSNTQNITLAQYQEINPVIALSENIRYSKSWTEGAGSRESLYPQLVLTISNYLFNWVGSASINELHGSSGADTSKRSVDTYWSSRWENANLPSLNINLGQDVAKSDDNPRSLDNRTIRAGVGMDWSVLIGKISFDYNHLDDYNKIDQRKDISDNYSLLFNISKLLLQNRLGVNFTQKINNQKRETTYQDRGGGGGITPHPVSISQTLYMNDPTPLNDQLIDHPSLMDGSTENSSINISSGQTINLGIKVDTQVVDRIYVFTLQDLTSSYLTFSWALYSSVDGSTWVLENNSVNFQYASNRFELEIPSLKKPYLKVVAIQPLLTTIDVTELKAFQLVSVTAGDLSIFQSTYDDYMSSLGVNVVISQHTNFSYNLSYEMGKPSSGQNFTRRSQTANLNLNQGNLLTVRFIAGDSAQEIESNPTTSSRSYGFSMSYPPISTVDINFGIDRGESFIDGVQKTVTQNYVLGANAGLYRDLDSAFEFRYNKNMNVGIDNETSNYLTSFNFSARVNPNVTSNFSMQYNSSSGGSINNDSTAMKFDISWRISDTVSFQTQARQQWSVGVDPFQFRISSDIAPTPKTQISMSYDLDESNVTAHNTTASLRWHISNKISWSFNTTYRDNSETFQYYFDTMISASF